MRLLVLTTLAAYASAQCNTAKPCNGYYWSKVTFGIAGIQCSAEDNVRKTLVSYIPVADAQVPKGSCSAANKTTAFMYTVYNLNGNQKNKVTDLQSNMKAFADMLRKVESFDSINTNTTSAMNSEVLCNGGSVFWEGNEFKKMSDQMINKRDYYQWKQDHVIFWKDGKWMYQAGTANPVAANPTCTGKPAECPKCAECKQTDCAGAVKTAVDAAKVASDAAIAGKDKEIASLDAKLKLANDMIAAKEKELGELKKQITTLQGEVAAEKKKVTAAETKCAADAAAAKKVADDALVAEQSAHTATKTQLTTCQNQIKSDSCKTDLVKCTGDLSAAESAKAAAVKGKTDAEAAQKKAEGDASACGTAKTKAEADLATCGTDKGKLQTDLDTANKAKANAEAQALTSADTIKTRDATIKKNNADIAARDATILARDGEIATHKKALSDCQNKPTPTCPACPTAKSCPTCPAKVTCPTQKECPTAKSCPTCPTSNNGTGCTQRCDDNLRTPILVEKDWWYCDELTFADCKDKTHGDAVQKHCPGLCGTCNKPGQGPVCEEKYHTKVMVEKVGSLYCDQLYPEECSVRGVSKVCCHTCSN